MKTVIGRVNGEYLHVAADGMGVLYHYGVVLLEPRKPCPLPDWEIRDARVVEVNGQPICKDEAFPYLFWWDKRVRLLAEADLAFSGGPMFCVTEVSTEGKKNG